MRKFIFVLLLISGISMLRAEVIKPDSIRFSLLTCAPGSEIYALFGHTAIRYENYTRKQDYVFNYGMFSFQTPNFVMRFLMGKTDYQLGVVPYSYFEVEDFWGYMNIWKDISLEYKDYMIGFRMRPQLIFPIIDEINNG